MGTRRSHKADQPLPTQILSRAGAANHFQNIRSQAFSEKRETSGRERGGRGNNNSNNSSGSSIRCIAWNGVGTRVACGNNDRSIRVWIPEHSDGKGLTSIGDAHDRSVESLSWDPLHADRLASCSIDGGLSIWDTRAKSLLAHVNTGHENVVVRYSCDGRFLAVVTAKTDLVIIYYVKKEGAKEVSVAPSRSRRSKTASWELVQVCQYRENDEIFDLQWGNNGSRTTYVLASGLGNGNVRLYKFNTSECLDKSEEKYRQDTPESEPATSTDSVTSTVQSVFTLRGHRTAVNCLEFDPKAQYLAVGSNEGIVSLWDLEEFICIKTFTKTDQAAISISISHDGSLMAVGSEGNAPIDIIHVESGEYIHSIPRAPSNGKSLVAWHPLKFSLAYVSDPSVLMILGAAASSGHSRN